MISLTTFSVLKPSYNKQIVTLQYKTRVMKNLILLAISAATLSACSSSYKSGQTPDDLYYAKAKQVETTTETNRDNGNKSDFSNYRDNVEERNIRFGINNRRWRSFDEYDFAYNSQFNPYNYGYCNSYYYNPYFYPYPVFNSISTNSNVKATVRTTLLSNYNTTVTTYTNTKYGATVRTNTFSSYNPKTVQQPTRTYRTRVFGDSRTYSPSQGSSSGGSGTRVGGSSSGVSSSSGGAVTRPSRGGNR
jgi:uncharacterized membrane protein YgcG